MNKIFYYAAAAAVSSVLLTGCFLDKYLGAFTGGEDHSPLPAELEEITPTVQLAKKWSVSTGSNNTEWYVRLTPAVVDDQLFVVNTEGALFAVDKNTGGRLWETDLEKPITGGLGTLDNTLLLVGTADGEVIAYQQDDGSEVWKTQLKSEVLTAPRGAGKHVIVYAADNTVYGLNASDGKIDWQVNNPMPALVLRGNSSPLTMGNQVSYVGLSNGRVIALNTENGRKLWEHVISLSRGRSELQRMVDISGQMALMHDTLYVVTYQGRAAALAVSSGRELWHREMSSYTGLNANHQYVTLSDADDTIWLLSAQNGTTIWQQETLAYRSLTAPVFWGEYLVVGDKEGYLHILSIDEGAFVGRLKVGGDGVVIPPFVVDDVLHVLTQNGKLTAYTLE